MHEGISPAHNLRGIYIFSMFLSANRPTKFVPSKNGSLIFAQFPRCCLKLTGRRNFIIFPPAWSTYITSYVKKYVLTRNLEKNPNM